MTTTTVTAVAAGDPPPRFGWGDIVHATQQGVRRYYTVYSQNGDYVNCLASDGAMIVTLASLLTLHSPGVFRGVAG